MSYAWMARGLALTSLSLLACSGDDTATGGGESSSSDDGPADSSGSPSTTAPGSESTTDTQGDTTVATLDSSSSESSGGGPSLCGNGDLDEGELCDDGNTDEGDACHADCTPSFEIAWDVLHDGAASAFDNANDVVIDGEGNVYALGNEDSPAGASVWLQQYLPDGSEGWVYRYDGTAGDDDFGVALVLTDDGDLVLTGGTTTPEGGYDILVLRLDGATQMVEWEVAVDGSGSGPGDADDDSGIAIALVDGGVAVVGSVSVDDQERDVWVGRYDDAGTELWTATIDGTAHGYDSAQAVVAGSDGAVIVFGTEDQGDDTALGIARVYDVDGVLQEADGQDFDVYVSDASSDADGNIFVVGYDEPGNTQLDALVRKYDASFTELWTATFDGSLDTDFADGVVVDDDGNVVIVGTTYRVGQQANALVAAFDPAGNPLWSDSFNVTDVDLAEQWFAVATDPDGDVVVGGYATILGHQGDAQIRKYHPL